MCPSQVPPLVYFFLSIKVCSFPFSSCGLTQLPDIYFPKLSAYKLLFVSLTMMVNASVFLRFLHSSPTGLPSLICIYANPLKVPSKEPNLTTETIRYISEASAKCQSIRTAPEAKLAPKKKKKEKKKKSKDNTKTRCNYYYNRSFFAKITANIYAYYVPSTVLSISTCI